MKLTGTRVQAEQKVLSYTTNPPPEQAFGRNWGVPPALLCRPTSLNGCRAIQFFRRCPDPPSAFNSGHLWKAKGKLMKATQFSMLSTKVACQQLERIRNRYASGNI
jgi:hypothetical protein